MRLAAKSKMDSNISDLLPVTSQGLAHGDDPLAGKLRFSDQGEGAVVRGDMDTAGTKWRSVVIADTEAERRSFDPSRSNITSLKKRFETSNLKNNEAYVIM